MDVPSSWRKPFKRRIERRFTVPTQVRGTEGRFWSNSEVDDFMELIRVIKPSPSGEVSFG